MSLDLHELPPDRRAPVALDAIAAASKQWKREHRRPAALSAREALAAVRFEAVFVWTAAANIRSGADLDEDDFERLTIACRWIDKICAEVLA